MKTVSLQTDIKVKNKGDGMEGHIVHFIRHGEYNAMAVVCWEDKTIKCVQLYQLEWI